MEAHPGLAYCQHMREAAPSGLRTEKGPTAMWNPMICRRCGDRIEPIYASPRSLCPVCFTKTLRDPETVMTFTVEDEAPASDPAECPRCHGTGFMGDGDEPDPCDALGCNYWAAREADCVCGDSDDPTSVDYRAGVLDRLDILEDGEGWPKDDEEEEEMRCRVCGAVAPAGVCDNCDSRDEDEPTLFPAPRQKGTGELLAERVSAFTAAVAADFSPADAALNLAMDREAEAEAGHPFPVGTIFYRNLGKCGIVRFIVTLETDLGRYSEGVGVGSYYDTLVSLNAELARGGITFPAEGASDQGGEDWFAETVRYLKGIGLIQNGGAL
jgi:hypothetical protein